MPKLILLHFSDIFGMLDPNMEGSIFSEVVLAAILDFQYGNHFHSKNDHNFSVRADIDVILVANPMFSISTYTMVLFSRSMETM